MHKVYNGHILVKMLSTRNNTRDKEDDDRLSNTMDIEDDDKISNTRDKEDDDGLSNTRDKEDDDRLSNTMDIEDDDRLSSITTDKEDDERLSSITRDKEDDDRLSSITRDKEDDDRLSSLSDDLIYKILSSIGFKDVIKLSVLSSRWRYIWTSTPYLNFSETDHPTPKFVIDVLSHRNISTALFSINLHDPYCSGGFEWASVKSILNYAFSHNVQHLSLRCFNIRNTRFPVSLFSSMSLKDLTLSGDCMRQFVMPPSTWDLSALTTLHLHYVTFYNNKNDRPIGLFSKCVNLRILTLNQCIMKGSEGFRICHPRLTDLTIIDREGKLFKGDYPLRFSKHSLHSLEKLDLCIMDPSEVDSCKVFGLLQHLHGVKILTLNLELIEFLSWSMEALYLRPRSAFANLKSLVVYPTYVYAYEDIEEICPLSTRIKKYFLKSSPSASLTLATLEDLCKAGNNMGEFDR